MISKWFQYQNRARELRQKGVSITAIERSLGIPRSTLSGWFKSITLTPKQKNTLRKKRIRALMPARHRAALWHKAAKERRLQEAEGQASKILSRLPPNNMPTLELALAMLYLGEGAKKTVETALGNSDPRVVKFFVTAIKRLYLLPDAKLRCELYLRADQNPIKLKRYWAKELKLPTGCFRQVRTDQRTAGIPTYPDYKGVCLVRCGTVAIQRRLISLARLYSQQVTE